MTLEVFEYDVALSFAGQDREAAEELGKLLAARNIRVFHDEYRGDETWRQDPLDHLVNLYARKARYGVLFLSGHYPLRAWTEAERASVKERALRDPKEYILPLLLDDTPVAGLKEGDSWDLHRHSLEGLADLLERKIAEARRQPGPPPRSHDLRSGNVPSTGRKPDRETR